MQIGDWPCVTVIAQNSENADRVLLRCSCVLYFRREDATTGQLDFVPAAVYPERQRVWVVGEGRGGLPAPGPGELPGFISATSLLPDYPFVRTRSAELAQPLGCVTRSKCTYSS